MSAELEKLFKDVDPEVIREAMEKAYAENQERIQKIDLNKHYRQACQIIDDNFAFFLSDVLNMGKPEWDSRIPTAAVYLPLKKTKLSDFRFAINPTFAALLEPEELAFILGHETMHIMLNHLRVAPRMKRQGAIDRKVNISMDVVINDYLRDQGFEISDRLRKQTCAGEDWCGYNAKYSTVREVYIDLDEDKWQQQKEAEEKLDALGKYLSELGLPATGGHEWIYSQESAAGVGDEISKGAPPQIQSKNNDEEQKVKKLSGGAASSGELVRRFQDVHGVSFKWAKLLQMVNPDFLKMHGPAPTTSFARIPRRMVYMHEAFPDMGRLPIKEINQPKNGETPAIAMYLDGSGSCYDWIDKFVKLAKSIPEERIALFPFSFSDIVMKLNIKEKNPELAGGGTEFSIIEESIRKDVVPVLGHYPKAVVIMSDGIGRFERIQPEGPNADRWLWLIKGNSPWNPRCGKDVPIHEFCEGMI